MWTASLFCQPLLELLTSFWCVGLRLLITGVPRALLLLVMLSTGHTPHSDVEQYHLLLCVFATYIVAYALH